MTTKEETLRRIQVMQAWCDGVPLPETAAEKYVYDLLVAVLVEVKKGLK